MPNTPSFFDAVIQTAQAFGETIQLIANDTSQSPLAPAESFTDDPTTYDPDTQSWTGENGLRYKVPLLDLPSELHTSTKKRNIRILLDNIRALSVNDDLPSTPDEKKFWTSYRFLKYQLFLKPYVVCLPPTYLLFRSIQSRLPLAIRGKFYPFFVSAVIAEQWMDATYPAHELLIRAMKAKTPLGDAARAEWQRLSPVNITMYTFTLYQGSLLIEPNKEFQFGGNVALALGSK